MDTGYFGGIGSKAVSVISVDTARELIYVATKAYLAIRADSLDASSQQIVLTLAGVNSKDHRRRVQVELESMRQALLARGQTLPNDSYEAGALLVILHAHLLQLVRDSTSSPVREALYQIVENLALDQERVWSAALALAEQILAAKGYDYTYTLQELKSRLLQN